MIDDIVVTRDGNTYCCSFNSGTAFAWVNQETLMTPHLTLVHKLNRYVIDNHVEGMFSNWGRTHLAQFNDLLGSLGATKNDYKRLGLDSLVDCEVEDEFRPRSPLHVLGYRVGNKGLNESERREILKNAVLGELPSVGTASYMAQWGMPATSERLKKILSHLRKISSGGGIESADYTKADEAWKTDIEWLKSTFSGSL